MWSPPGEGPDQAQFSIPLDRSVADLISAHEAHDHQAVLAHADSGNPPRCRSALSAAAARSTATQDERQWLGISLTTSNLADLRKLTYNHLIIAVEAEILQR